ncbi:MAG: glycoside hydrolase family 3 N-terminal domain-containing protein [Candidatus Aminicenantia bacterium]
MRIGQFFFIKIEESEPNNTLLSFLSRINPGGIVLFSENLKTPSQTFNLLTKIREYLNYPVFLSVDLEGGKVDRLKHILYPFPSWTDLGKAKNKDLIKRHAKLTARALKLLGFNTNFSPVVDLDFSQTNGLEGRTLGQNPDYVTSMAKIYLKEVAKYQILSTLKHFPGLGRAKEDTHQVLSSINTSWHTLKETDLVPFKKLNPFSPFIMVNHAHYSCLNQEILPASLSKTIIKDLLKYKLNYSSIVITDDLTMGALKNFKEAPLRAFESGADMLLICAPGKETEAWFKKFKEIINRGEISWKRLKSSLRRIRRIQKLISSFPTSFNPNEIDGLIKEIETHSNELKKYLK